MPLSVIVWGTGNVGRPAIRAVLAHADLDLKAVIVSNPDKVGVDAGTLAGTAPCGLAARDDWQEVLAEGADALIAQTAGLLRDRREGRSDNTEPFGILTHHLVHDQDIWAFTEALLRKLLSGPATAWAAPENE